MIRRATYCCLALILFTVQALAQSATISDIKVNPSAGRYPKVMIEITCKIQVDGMQGKNLFFRCHIYKGNNAVPGGYQDLTATPPYPNSVWNPITFRMSQRYFIDQKLWGSKLHAWIFVYEQGTNRRIGCNGAEFQFGSAPSTNSNPGGIAPAGRSSTPTTASSVQPKLNNSNVSKEEDPYQISAAICQRLKPHPQGRKDIYLDPELVGEWMTAEYIKTNGTAFMQGKTNTLKGAWKIVSLKFNPDGTALLETFYPAVVVSGQGVGNFVFGQKADESSQACTWGIETIKTPEGTATMFRLEFSDKSFARGLYLSISKNKSFIFLYYDEKTQKYDAQRMLYHNKDGFIKDWNENIQKLVRTNQDMIKARELWIYAKNQAMLNQMSMWNFQMNMLNQSHQTSMNIINNIR